MEFEEFIVDFAHWFSDGKKTACLVGIRAEESLNPLPHDQEHEKARFMDYGWSTRVSDAVYNFYPIYDWRTKDIWIANGRSAFATTGFTT